MLSKYLVTENILLIYFLKRPLHLLHEYGLMGVGRKAISGMFSHANNRKIIEPLWIKEMSYFFTQNMMSEGVAFVSSESELMSL